MLVVPFSKVQVRMVDQSLQGQFYACADSAYTVISIEPPYIVCYNVLTLYILAGFAVEWCIADQKSDTQVSMQKTLSDQ